jgi:hypothetical protein
MRLAGAPEEEVATVEQAVQGQIGATPVADDGQDDQELVPVF